MSLAVGLAGRGIYSMVSAAAQEVESLDNLSTKTGIATQDLQALAQIQKNAGMEGVDLARTIGRINAELGKGKGEFVEGLKRIGINPQLKDGITVLDELGKKLNAIEDPAKRAQVQAAVLGVRVQELSPLFVNTTQSVREQINAVIDLGGAYSAATLEGLRKFDRMQDTIDTVLKGVKIQIASFAADLIDTAPKIADFAKVALSPVMAFYKIGEAISDTKIKIAEFYLWIAKTIGDQGGIKGWATILRDAAASSLEWNKKITGLEVVVDGIGKTATVSGNKIKTNWADSVDKASDASRRWEAAVAKLEAAMKKEHDELADATIGVMKFEDAVNKLNPSLIENAKAVDAAAEKLRKYNEELDVFITAPPTFKDFGIDEIEAAFDKIRKEEAKTQESTNDWTRHEHHVDQHDAGYRGESHALGWSLQRLRQGRSVCPHGRAF